MPKQLWNKLWNKRNDRTKNTHVDKNVCVRRCAEMVGVEPTRPCGPIAFRVRPLTTT